MLKRTAKCAGLARAFQVTHSLQSHDCRPRVSAAQRNDAILLLVASVTQH